MFRHGRVRSPLGHCAACDRPKDAESQSDTQRESERAIALGAKALVSCKEGEQG